MPTPEVLKAIELMASQLHADVRKLKAYSAVEQLLYKNEEVTELKRLVIVRAFYQCIRSNVLECSVFGALGIGATLVSMAIAVHFRLSSFIAATGLISCAVAKGIQALKLYFGLRK